MKQLVLAALIAASAIAPAAAGTGSEGCLWANQIDGFRNATTDSVVLTAGAKAYLAEFTGGCTGLKWANSVATVAHTSCLTAGDSIRFYDGAMHQRCMISKLTKVEKQAAN